MFFYHSNIKNQHIIYPDSEHLFVCRVKVDQVIQVSDFRGSLLEVKIKKVDKNQKNILIETIKKQYFDYQNFLDTSPVLIQALPDKNYLDKMVELLPFTDFGQVFVFNSDFSPKYSLNLERINKILLRSLEQSQSVFTPKITLLNSKIELEELLVKIKPKVLTCDLILSPKIDLDSNITNKSVVVGPEGGWSQRENDMFSKLQLQMLNLGNKIYPSWLAGLMADLKV